MFGRIFGGIYLVGRATVFLVGLAVVVGLLLGASSVALGANGKPFLLGKKNVASKVSKLVKRGAGPALNLQVGSGPPLSVNSSEKVKNLNADELDGRSLDEIGVNGRYSVILRSAVNSESPKRYTGSCPDGMRVLSGGAVVDRTGTPVAITGSGPTFDGNGWSVRVEEMQAYSGNWGFEFKLLCAKTGVPPGAG